MPVSNSARYGAVFSIFYVSLSYSYSNRVEPNSLCNYFKCFAIADGSIPYVGIPDPSQRISAIHMELSMLPRPPLAPTHSRLVGSPALNVVDTTIWVACFRLFQLVCSLTCLSLGFPFELFISTILRNTPITVKAWDTSITMATPGNSASSIPWWFRLGVLFLCFASAYVAFKLDAPEAILAFCTGPGSYSRILAVLFLVLNWKSLPFAWSVR